VKGARSALGGDRRRPFTEQEAILFLAALRGVDRDVVQLLAVTGLRLEEAASLLVGDVEDTEDATWIRITAGKTAAARRRIPVVVAEVRSMLRERCSASSDGAVFHELPADRNGDRSRALTKRLGWALREKLHIADRSLVAAHGWRHRARTKLEAASISPWTADFFLGHMRYGEGLSRYSKPSDEQLVKAARAVPLPAGS
jgi:integrase